MGVILTFPIWGLFLILNPRYRKGLRERIWGLPASEDGPDRSSIWVHASSLGEVKVSAPVCKALSADFPEYAMVFSTSTPVGKKQAISLLDGIQAVFLLPMDLQWVVCRAVRRYHPKFFLVAETEFWPNLFFCMKRKGVPVALFNGRISDRSFKRYRLFRLFFKEVLSCVELFCVQTEQDAKRFRLLGAPEDRIRVTGNVKFDAVETPLSSEEIVALQHSLRIEIDEPLWIAGSIHPEEFPVLMEAWKAIKADHPEVRWIVIPRHLYDIPQFKDALENQNIQVVVWKGKSEVTDPWDVLLVNALGQLVRLYQLGFCAFVGGSLAPIGGHNPLEPLRYGIPTLFGPRMENFREIRRILLRESMGVEVANANELASAVRRFLVDKEARTQVKIEARKFFDRYQGATNRSIHNLKEWIINHS